MHREVAASYKYMTEHVSREMFFFIQVENSCHTGRSCLGVGHCEMDYEDTHQVRSTKTVCACVGGLLSRPSKSLRV
jgi:hypothetical protein